MKLAGMRGVAECIALYVASLLLFVLRSSFTTCVWTCASITSLRPLMAVLGGVLYSRLW